MLYEYADLFLVHLDNRYKLYQESDYYQLQLNILAQIDYIVDQLGPYSVATYMPLLVDMKHYSNMLVLLSLIFSIVTILFVTISTLLIYSLLMISMEDKTFENGVMRLIGMSKYKVSSVIFL
jgi:hypothetical protein